MSNLEKRVRAIMEREKLTWEQLADYADVSSQAVHKWLSSGAISDRKSKVLAREIGLDWLWLKHGVTRLPMEAFFDSVLNSTESLGLVCWDTLEVLAVGPNIVKEFEYNESEILGRSVMSFAPSVSESDVRKVQKINHALHGLVDYSFRVNIHDKYTVRPYSVSHRGTTTDNEGLTYAIEEIQKIQPNGTEDSLRSLRFKRRSPAPLAKHEINALVEKFPEFPWLSDI